MSHVGNVLRLTHANVVAGYITCVSEVEARDAIAGRGGLAHAESVLSRVLQHAEEYVPRYEALDALNDVREAQGKPPEIAEDAAALHKAVAESGDALSLANVSRSMLARYGDKEGK